MRFYIFTFFLLFACAEINTDKENVDGDMNDYDVINTSTSSNQKENTIKKSKWICHHPNTVFHNKECIEEEYPLGCYVSGNLHKFCWLLHEDDCDADSNDDMSESCANAGYSN
jgi:hypothetical protein